jgi:hypothetical protein
MVGVTILGFCCCDMVEVKQEEYAKDGFGGGARSCRRVIEDGGERGREEG